MENIMLFCLCWSFLLADMRVSTLTETQWISTALSIDLVFHPTSLTAATSTLSSAGLVNVIGHKPALPVRAWHILIIVTLGVLGRSAWVFCHDVCCHTAVQSSVRQFVNVTKCVRSLYGARWSCCWHPGFGSAGITFSFCLPPACEHSGIHTWFNRLHTALQW